MTLSEILRYIQSSKTNLPGICLLETLPVLSGLVFTSTICHPFFNAGDRKRQYNKENTLPYLPHSFVFLRRTACVYFCLHNGINNASIAFPMTYKHFPQRRFSNRFSPTFIIITPISQEATWDIGTVPTNVITTGLLYNRPFINNFPSCV